MVFQKGVEDCHVYALWILSEHQLPALCQRVIRPCRARHKPGFSHVGERPGDSVGVGGLLPAWKKLRVFPVVRLTLL